MAGTEMAKRRATMSILEKLRAEGTPGKRTGPMSSKYSDKFTDEALPLSEEAQQDEFEKQKGARTEQSLVNEAPAGVTSAVYNATADVAAGPTGMSPTGTPSSSAGMVPYSPEEFERRSQFSRMEMPAKRKKKQSADELADSTDEPAQVNATY